VAENTPEYFITRRKKSFSENGILESQWKQKKFTGNMAMHVIKGSKFLRLQKNAFWVGISHPNHLAHFFTKRKILTL